MKVLQLCYKIPFPRNDGGAYSLSNAALSLMSNEEVDLKVLAMCQIKNGDNPDLVPESFRTQTRFESVKIDNRIKLIDAFFNLFSSRSYFTERFDSKLFELKLEEVLSNESFDIIQIEHIYLGSYIEVIRRYSKGKIVLRAQNVEHQLWKSYLQTSNLSFIKRIYLQKMVDRLKKEEIEVLNNIDALICLSNEDLLSFENYMKNIPCSVIPIAIEDVQSTTKITNAEPVVYHLGSMDWLPNKQGVDWFLKHVLPEVRKRNKQILFHFAGKNMPDNLIQYSNDQLIIEGEVESAIEFQSDKEIMIVPLLSGGGIRVKIIEGLALGKVIVSTSKGAEGLDCKSGENILIANTPEEFCNAIIACFESKELREKLSRNARVLFETKFQIKTVGEALLGFYSEL